MKYTITVEEICMRDFEIEANSKEEALKKAWQGYDKGDYVLNWSNLEETNITINDFPEH